MVWCFKGRVEDSLNSSRRSSFWKFLDFDFSIVSSEIWEIWDCWIVVRFWVVVMVSSPICASRVVVMSNQNTDPFLNSDLTCRSPPSF